jgi:exopolyphosphatase
MRFGMGSRVVPADKKRKSYQVLPIVNCKKEDLPLKTEVTHWLKKHEIDLDNLICRDEIDIEKRVENFILVDHHVSPFHERVISVLDHRPYDEKSNLGDECAVNIQEVGSCATLVAEAMKTDLGSEGLNNFKDVLHLLYGPIVLDTINFSKEADKVRELDFEMAALIERKLDIGDVTTTRKSLFDELVEARANVGALNSLQVLSKDLKIISNKNSSVRVALPGVLVFDYVNMPNAADNLRAFAERENIDVVMLMGMKPVGNSVERHLGVINIKNMPLYKDILNTVKSMSNPELRLQFQEHVQFLNGEFFIQENVKASRKQILPVIKELLESY